MSAIGKSPKENQKQWMSFMFEGSQLPSSSPSCSRGASSPRAPRREPGSSGSRLFLASAFLRRQEVDEVLGRSREQGDEALKRRLHRREERGPKLVLAGHGRELVLDAL